MTIYEYLNKYFAGAKDGCILEVGAHIGTDTVKLSRYTIHGRLICFEPDPRNIAELLALQDTVKFELIKKAVVDKTGEVTFYQSFGKKPGLSREITDFSSTKAPTGARNKHPWAIFKEIKVEGTTLDCYCQANDVKNIDLIWADIQGGELDLVLGAQETLRLTKLFYFECMKHPTNLYKDQPTLQQIITALPNPKKWSMIFASETDVLLKSS